MKLEEKSRMGLEEKSRMSLEEKSRMSLEEKFYRLKTSIAGNREKKGFEYSFGMPREEQHYITGPSKWNTRIISELEFALHLSDAVGLSYHTCIEKAVDFLLQEVEENGVLGNSVCERAEEMLQELEKPSKEYQLILAAHAHIDMNWKWSYYETVSIVLNTFRTMLHIMKEYPKFCYSQSQASVYKIVEEQDPELMEEIKQQIQEGRWEVTATAWVETDKNMPTGESLLRHIQYTKEYLSSVWGVKDFELDFSPDTFGHNGNIPEIDSFGEVKYLYHCRGNDRDSALYRYRSPSGKEVLVYREPNWYNAGITPQIGAGLMEIVRQSAGLKTGLVVYGVGDHGGGPTRRDVERALEMMEWKIYPKIRFGTILEYFHEAEAVRDQLPVVDEELNYFAPGCYTTQSRIKRGNRQLERALLDAERLCVQSGQLVDMQYPNEKMQEAWTDVLFTHFHDILTGSCVQDSREYAMGLYQKSMAVAHTQIQNAMRKIAERIDTSFVMTDSDISGSQSEGAGVGYGIDHFTGVPGTEQGCGLTRIFHVFNTATNNRTDVALLTIWDWTGDLRRLQIKDHQGNLLKHQLLDQEYQHYWDHKYIRVLVEATVPAMGYTTVIVEQKDSDAYPVYLLTGRTSGFYDDTILENEYVKVRISANTGRVTSYIDKKKQQEMIAPGASMGLVYQETERMTSSAWDIGRMIQAESIQMCVAKQKKHNGELRNSILAEYTFHNSSAKVEYLLDRNSPCLQVKLEVDWHEIGKDTVPVLSFDIPLSYETDTFYYDIPFGSAKRKPIANDVPGLQYGMAFHPNGSSAILINDSKYGYRGECNQLKLTLINSAVSPDPYPERGIHHVNLWIGAGSGDLTQAEQMACLCNHELLVQSSNRHKGELRPEGSVLQTDCENAIVTAVIPSEDQSLIVRGYETQGRQGLMKLSYYKAVTQACLTNLFGKQIEEEVSIDKNEISFPIKPYSIFELKLN